MQHPNQKEYTWHQTNPNIRCRLDYFLISKNLIHSAKNSKIYSAIKTDHKIISLKLNLGLTARGPGFWKFNSSFLSDKEYITMITQLITNKWKEHLNIDDLRVRWDLLKFEIQSASMSYSKSKAKARRERESLLLSKIESLDKKIIDNTATASDLDKFEQLKLEYENIQEYKSKGAYIRSRIQVIEEDEKSSKYFYNQAKVSFDKKSISKIECEDNTIKQDPKQILQELKKFYSNLYSSSKPNLDDHTFTKIQNLRMPQCDLDEQNYLDSPISLHECKEALNTMPENKSPGQDGLSYEFYKTLWPTIGPLFHKTLQYSLGKGELSLSQRRAVITLLQKRGKNEYLIKNWRPISLLNCDYKLLTKILSRRIQPLLPKLLHPDQVGFVPNRFIGENIRYIEDLIDYCKRLRKKCIILNIDIEKAFDTLEWEFIFVALKKYNFGPNIIKWISKRD